MANKVKCIGIEIETVNLNPHDVATALNRHGILASAQRYNHIAPPAGHWKVTTDCSLRRNPSAVGSDDHTAEVVSYIMPYGTATEKDVAHVAIRQVCAALVAAGCAVNRTCGLHVHVGSDPQAIAYRCPVGWTNGERYAIAKRYQTFQETIKTFLPESRRNGRWCRDLYRPVPLADDEFGQTRSHYAGGMDKYFAVNLACAYKYGTVEFRAASSTLNADKMINWIKFVTQFSDYSTATVPTATVSTATVSTLDSVNDIHGIVTRLTEAGYMSPRMTNLRECQLWHVHNFLGYEMPLNQSIEQFNRNVTHLKVRGWQFDSNGCWTGVCLLVIPTTGYAHELYHCLTSGSYSGSVSMPLNHLRVACRRLRDAGLTVYPGQPSAYHADRHHVTSEGRLLRETVEIYRDNLPAVPSVPSVPSVPPDDRLFAGIDIDIQAWLNDRARQLR